MKSLDEDHQKYRPFLTRHKSLWARAGIWLLNGLFFSLVFWVMLAFILNFFYD